MRRATATLKLNRSVLTPEELNAILGAVAMAGGDSLQPDNITIMTTGVVILKSPTTSQHVSLNRAEIQKYLLENYVDLVNKVTPALYKDVSGKVVSFTAGDLSYIPLSKKLSLEDAMCLPQSTMKK